MTDLKALREAAVSALDCLPFPEAAEFDPDGGTTLEDRHGNLVGWMTSGAHADFVVLANPTAIIGLLDRLKEAEEAVKETRDTLMNLQPHMHSTRQQAGPFCAAAQIVDDEISRAMKQVSAHLERHNNE